jgi:ribonucleoside-diphosphate reductase beta chain
MSTGTGASERQEPLDIAGDTPRAEVDGDPGSELFKEPEQPLPGYLDLYRRWEKQHWSIYDLDLSVDRRQWQAAAEADRRKWFCLGRFPGFLLSEARAAEELSHYLQTIPGEERQLYLTTQLVDEARHLMFFKRYCQEVLGADPKLSSAGGPASLLSPAARHLVVTALGEVSATLRARPQDPLAQARAVFLFHVVLEGSVAMSLMRVVWKDFRRLGVLPGFQRGIAALLRDETRHVLFGVRFLHDLAAETPALRGHLRRFLLEDLLPWVDALIETPPQRVAELAPQGIEPGERRTFALALLRRHLQALGISDDLPVALPGTAAA